jgi:hypothetical protein
MAAQLNRQKHMPIRTGYDNNRRLFCKEKHTSKVYNTRSLRDNRSSPTKFDPMAQSKIKQESRLQELILRAKDLNIQVRAEKLLREAGYRARSGSCRVNGKEIILIDRATPIGDQIDFLAGELAERQSRQEENTKQA